MPHGGNKKGHQTMTNKKKKTNSKKKNKHLEEGQQPTQEQQHGGGGGAIITATADHGPTTAVRGGRGGGATRLREGEAEADPPPARHLMRSRIQQQQQQQNHPSGRRGPCTSQHHHHPPSSNHNDNLLVSQQELLLPSQLQSSNAVSTSIREEFVALTNKIMEEQQQQHQQDHDVEEEEEDEEKEEQPGWNKTSTTNKTQLHEPSLLPQPLKPGLVGALGGEGGGRMGHYERYKEAPRRCFDGIQQMVAGTTIQVNTVQSLCDAVDWIAEQMLDNNNNNNSSSSSSTTSAIHDDDIKDISNGETTTKPSSPSARMMPTTTIQLDDTLLSDFKLSIRLRQQSAQMQPDGIGDTGHAYIIAVLNYCWIVLRQIKKNQSTTRHHNMITTPPMDTTKKQQPENRFESLSTPLDDDEDNDDDSDDNVPLTRPTRPVAPEGKDTMSLDEVVNGSAYLQVYFLLMITNEMMRLVSNHYQNIKDFVRQNNTTKMYPMNSVLKDVMNAAVDINYYIQIIVHFEQDLEAQYPYLNSIYRILTLFCLRDYIHELIININNYSPRHAEFTTVDAICFLGDCIQCGFCFANDADDHLDDIVNKFGTQWQLPDHVLIEHSRAMTMAVAFEAPLPHEMARFRDILDRLASADIVPHTWLKYFPYIGGDRSIVYTVRIIQGFGEVLGSRKGPVTMIINPAMFKRRWDEGSNRAQKIHGDMDDFLLGEFLLTIHDMCENGMLSMNLPMENELLTFFTIFKSFIRAPTKPISWALAFAIQAVLTSVFEMQGNEDVSNLGQIAKKTWDDYIKQMVIALDNDGNATNTKRWKDNLKLCFYLGMITPKGIASREVYSVWNPLCAGYFLSYMIFYMNLHRGSHLIDSSGQLRLVLHLYNALIQSEILRPKQIEVLDFLFEIFKSCKAVWEGPIPIKGQLVKRWWITWGMKPDAARDRSQAMIESGNNLNSNVSTKSKRNHRQDNLCRSSPTSISPKTLSLSYRRLCGRDYSDDTNSVEKHPFADKSSYGSLQALGDQLTLIKLTSLAMNAEQRLLTLNFTYLGYILNQFLAELFEALDWKPLVDEMVDEFFESMPPSMQQGPYRNAAYEHYERCAMVDVFVNELLGVMDVQNRNVEGTQQKNELCIRTSELMTTFFENRPRLLNCIIFHPVTSLNEHGEVEGSLWG